MGSSTGSAVSIWCLDQHKLIRYLYFKVHIKNRVFCLSFYIIFLLNVPSLNIHA